MANYTISEAAKLDLQNIYRFGFQRFGEEQAERYYNGLIACFDEIAKNPFQFQQVAELGAYRRCVYIAESIYFRIQDEKVQIMAIIGRQDAMLRL